MPGLIQANTALDGTIDETVRSTFAEMLERRVPNLFRLYLNPYVAQACYCLTELIRETWPEHDGREPYQVFLANSMEEALSGGLKLARYVNNRRGRSPGGIVVDVDDRLRNFAATSLDGGNRVEFIPSLDVVDDVADAIELMDRQCHGFVAFFHSWLKTHADEVEKAFNCIPARSERPLLIVITDRDSIGTLARTALPDVVVFDESFTNWQVPLGAFAAHRSLMKHWTKRSMTTFHSTTYQPNTISTLQFLNCLRHDRPDFIERHAAALRRIARDFRFRHEMFTERYNGSLAKLIHTIGWHEAEAKTAGHYIQIKGKRLFDGVAGVACSIRGHNPSRYLAELDQLGRLAACREDLTERLHKLTGLPHATPAVSGASAVEHALKLGLTCQFPKNHVLVMRGGFGGKTLFALTGTWKKSLRQGIDPLYPHVVYVDPFVADAVAAVEAAFECYSIGVAQFELIQGVGGVRALPTEVLECLLRMRERHGCLLFVDEVQTGVYRTGPFIRSTQLGLHPDLLTIGKGASDMMFPYALSLHTAAIENRLAAAGCDLPAALRARYDYEVGLRTMLNVLRYAEDQRLSEAVRARGEQFQRLLNSMLRDCRNVREVRSFGLLIGIELATGTGMRRSLGRLRRQLAPMAMMKHPQTQLLVGYCQYDPHVLKLTPPLSVSPEEVERVCQTIADVLHMPTWKLAKTALLPVSHLSNEHKGDVMR
jgi:acetylornithine/succinyldiaminopimelate/putrescine aminotransferase